MFCLAVNNHFNVANYLSHSRLSKSLADINIRKRESIIAGVVLGFVQLVRVDDFEGSRISLTFLVQIVLLWGSYQVANGVNATFVDALKNRQEKLKQELVFSERRILKRLICHCKK
jgi:hypothetical protein